MATYKGRFLDWFVCIRPAKFDDYDDVMRIDDNIYGGADYLLYDYHDLLANRTANPYELKGKRDTGGKGTLKKKIGPKYQNGSLGIRSPVKKGRATAGNENPPV